jgi:hypothetical protein
MPTSPFGHRKVQSLAATLLARSGRAGRYCLCGRATLISPRDQRHLAPYHVRQESSARGRFGRTPSPENRGGVRRRRYQPLLSRAAPVELVSPKPADTSLFSIGE